MARAKKVKPASLMEILVAEDKLGKAIQGLGESTNENLKALFPDMKSDAYSEGLNGLKSLGRVTEAYGHIKWVGPKG